MFDVSPRAGIENMRSRRMDRLERFRLPPGNPARRETDLSMALSAALTGSPRPSARQLLHDVCDAYGANPDEVCGPMRHRRLVEVRRSAARVLRSAGYSLPDIGHALGGRHHTTVMNLLDPDVAQRKYLAAIGATQRTWRAA